MHAYEPRGICIRHSTRDSTIAFVTKIGSVLYAYSTSDNKKRLEIRLRILLRLYCSSTVYTILLQRHCVRFSTRRRLLLADIYTILIRLNHRTGLIDTHV